MASLASWFLNMYVFLLFCEFLPLSVPVSLVILGVVESENQPVLELQPGHVSHHSTSEAPIKDYTTESMAESPLEQARVQLGLVWQNSLIPTW